MIPAAPSYHNQDTHQHRNRRSIRFENAIYDIFNIKIEATEGENPRDKEGMLQICFGNAPFSPTPAGMLMCRDTNTNTLRLCFHFLVVSRLSGFVRSR